MEGQRTKQQKLENQNEDSEDSPLKNTSNGTGHREAPSRKAKLKAREASQQQAKDSQYTSADIEEPVHKPHRRAVSSKAVVDFSKLDVAALKRYKRVYHLKTRQNSTKIELIAAVTKHFGTLPVNEVEIVDTFLTNINMREDAENYA